MYGIINSHELSIGTFDDLDLIEKRGLNFCLIMKLLSVKNKLNSRF